jgi:hypothetical protein
MLTGMSGKSQTVQLLILALLVGTCSGALLAMLAPYQTAVIFSARDRFLFWIASAVFGCLTLVVFYVAGSSIARDYRISRFFWVPVSATLAAIPVTLIVHAVAPAINARIELQAFWKLYPSVLILCIPLQLIIQLLVQQFPETREPGNVSATRSNISPLFDKIPPQLGSDIICLKMEDHYLRVYTSKGNTLILMRISDAAKMLGALDGMRVHRSWWVARSAVASAKTDRHNFRLVLNNGLEVPVSRERRPFLEANRWPGC